jgi:hypothetical protein
MPIDFIDQLSKFEKSPIVSIECRLLLRAFQRLGEYLFRIKRFGSFLDGQKIKIF